MKRILCLVVAVTPLVAHADKSLTKNGTWDCKKDPTVHIANGDGKFVFKGKCKTIDIGGGSNSLTIESVDKLDVGGGENRITAKSVTTLAVGGSENMIVLDAIGSIDVGGSDNKITWKKALSGNAPTISGEPDKNTIIQIGGVSAGAASGGSAGSGGAISGGASAGTTVDCSTNPTFTYDDNGGTFTFTGKCDTIAINGNEAHLTIESVKSLAISGNNAVATVTAVDVIATPGNNNKVTYKKSVSAARVKVSNPGNKNKITKVK